MNDLTSKIVGHRGAGFFYPENTLGALRLAAKLGLKQVEFDVRLTRDGKIVVSHDDSLQRCGYTDLKLSEHNFDEVKEVNVAAYYGRAAYVETIPTLQQFLELAGELNLHCQIELKPNSHDSEELAKAVATLLDKFFAKTENKLPLVTSFNPACLVYFKQSTQLKFQTGVLIKQPDTSNWEAIGEHAHSDFIHLYALHISQEVVMAANTTGYKVGAIHLNSPEIAKSVLAAGCARFTCDALDVFLPDSVSGLLGRPVQID